MQTIWERDGWQVRRNQRSCSVTRSFQPRESITLVRLEEGAGGFLFRSPMLLMRANQTEAVRVEFSNGSSITGNAVTTAGNSPSEALLGFGTGGVDLVVKELALSTSARVTIGRFKALDIDLTDIQAALDAMRLCATNPGSFPIAGATPRPAFDFTDYKSERSRSFAADASSVTGITAGDAGACSMAMQVRANVSVSLTIQRNGNMSFSAFGPEWQPAQAGSPVRIVFSNGRSFEGSVRREGQASGVGIATPLNSVAEEDLIEAWAGASSVRVSVPNVHSQSYEYARGAEKAAAFKRCLANIRLVRRPASLFS